MQLFNPLVIPLWGKLAETGIPAQNLGFIGSARFNETCDSLENAEKCENHCQIRYYECVQECENDQDFGQIFHTV